MKQICKDRAQFYATILAGVIASSNHGSINNIAVSTALKVGDDLLERLEARQSQHTKVLKASSKKLLLAS